MIEVLIIILILFGSLLDSPKDLISKGNSPGPNAIENPETFVRSSFRMASFSFAS